MWYANTWGEMVVLDCIYVVTCTRLIVAQYCHCYKYSGGETEGSKSRISFFLPKIHNIHHIEDVVNELMLGLDLSSPNDDNVVNVGEDSVLTVILGD